MNLHEMVMQASALVSKLPQGAARARDLEDCLREVRNRIARVLVVGPDKAGKSTLVNVLSRKVVARTGVTPVKIDGGVVSHPWGGDLLCDTMGYLADRKGTMPEQIAAEIGRGTLVVFLMHWEGLCPADRQLLEQIRHLGVPLLIGINRMDETDDQPATRRDIENQVRSQIPWLVETQLLFLSLRNATDDLNAGGWGPDVKLPAPVLAFEARIRSMLEQEKKNPDAPVVRRTREHLEWFVKELTGGAGSIRMSALKRLQDEVKGKEKWLAARVDLRVAEQMGNFDRLQEALVAAIDAADSDRVGSVQDSFQKYSDGLPKTFSASLAPDLESARRDLVRAIREAAEDLEKTHPTIDVQAGEVDGEALGQAAKAAAEHVAEASQATDEALANLARLSKAMGWRLAGGAGVFALIEGAEEGAKYLLPGAAEAGTTAVQKAAEGAGGAVAGAGGGGFSVEDVGNALQAVAIVITAIMFIRGLLQQREKVEAAKKDVSAKLALARTSLRIGLESDATRIVSAILAPFDLVLDRMASRLKDEFQQAEGARHDAERILSALPTPHADVPVPNAFAN